VGINGIPLNLPPILKLALEILLTVLEIYVPICQTNQLPFPFYTVYPAKKLRMCPKNISIFMATSCRWLSVFKPALLDDALVLNHSQFDDMDMNALEMGKLKNLLQYFKKVWFDGIFHRLEILWWTKGYKQCSGATK
jgi:hypothetical protein